MLLPLSVTDDDDDDVSMPVATGSAILSASGRGDFCFNIFETTIRIEEGEEREGKSIARKAPLVRLTHASKLLPCIEIGPLPKAPTIRSKGDACTIWQSCETPSSNGRKQCTLPVNDTTMLQDGGGASGGGKRTVPSPARLRYPRWIREGRGTTCYCEGQTKLSRSSPAG